jgi:hypothetical protein
MSESEVSKQALPKELNQKTGKEWAWFFYENLGYRIVEDKEDEDTLEKTMNNLVEVAEAEIKKTLLEKGSTENEWFFKIIEKVWKEEGYGKPTENEKKWTLTQMLKDYKKLEGQIADYRKWLENANPPNCIDYAYVVNWITASDKFDEVFGEGQKQESFTHHDGNGIT